MSESFTPLNLDGKYFFNFLTSKCSNSNHPPFDVTICSTIFDFGWFLSAFSREVVEDDSISMTWVEFTVKLIKRKKLFLVFLLFVGKWSKTFFGGTFLIVNICAIKKVFIDSRIFDKIFKFWATAKKEEEDLHLRLTWFSAAGNCVRLKFSCWRCIRVWHFATYLIKRNGIGDRNLWLMIDIILMNIGIQRQWTFRWIDRVVVMWRWHVMWMMMIEGIDCHCVIFIGVGALLHRLQLLAITFLAVIWVCLWLYLENFCDKEIIRR